MKDQMTVEGIDPKIVSPEDMVLIIDSGAFYKDTERNGPHNPLDAKIDPGKVHAAYSSEWFAGINLGLRRKETLL
jgi:hypothetical protein